MKEATLIVAPSYLAEMTGVTAIKVTARKLYQCDATLRTIKSCFRRNTDDVATLSFIDLIELIDTRDFLETAHDIPRHLPLSHSPREFRGVDAG